MRARRFCLLDGKEPAPMVAVLCKKFLRVDIVILQG